MDELRAQIDQTDQAIVELIQKRTKLTEEIGHRKKKDGLPIYRSDRHTAVYHKVSAGIKDPVLRQAIQSIYREIMSLGMAVEGELKIYCSGDSSAQIAARLVFGSSVQIESSNVKTIQDKIRADVNAFGFIPAVGPEFSEVLPAMIEDSVLIYAEAVSQSATYFVLSRATVASTGDDRTTVACIPLSGESADNLVDMILHGQKNKTSDTNAAYRVVTAQNKHYSILDFPGHKDEPDTAMILDSLKSRCTFLKILGSYPRAVSG